MFAERPSHDGGGCAAHSRAGCGALTRTVLPGHRVRLRPLRTLEVQTRADLRIGRGEQWEARPALRSPGVAGGGRVPKRTCDRAVDAGQIVAARAASSSGWRAMMRGMLATRR